MAVRTLALFLALAVVVPVVARGGFPAGSRSALIALAGLALLAASRVDQSGALRLMRSNAVPALVALGALAAISAAWTVGEPADAVRAGAATVALAAVAVSAGVLTRSGRGWWIALGVALLAGLEGMLGLGSAALHSTPFAEKIGGAWQPGGTFEYAPALAALQVMALPVLLRWLGSANPVARYGAALGIAIAGASLGLSASRLQQALGLAVFAAAIVWPRLAATPRPVSISGLLMALLAGLGTVLVVGGEAPASKDGMELERLLFQAALAIALAAITAATVRRLPAALARRMAPRHGVLLAGMIATIGVAGIVVAYTERPVGRGVEGESGLLGGRTQQWEAALEVGAERPVKGAGAESFFAASRARQGPSPVLYAHSLPLETWAELGALGAACVLWLYSAVAIAARRALEPPGWPYLAGALAFPLANLLDWSWHLFGLGAIWAALLGALIAAAWPPTSTQGARGRVR